MAEGMLVVPEGLRQRGFGLYVGFTAPGDGERVGRLEEELRRRLAELVPAAECTASVVSSPLGTDRRALDVVRLALREPVATAALASHAARRGVVVDLDGRRLWIDGSLVDLTARESALLALLIARAGEPVSRATLRRELPQDESGRAGESGRLGESGRPGARSVDVLVGRLRGKLRPYHGVVRTVRARGYRFDRHPDVTLLAESRGD